MRKGQKKLANKYDPDFRFLLALDPVFETWRAWAAQWMSEQNDSTKKRAALGRFFVAYLHAHGLHSLPPADLFRADTRLPDLGAALGFDQVSEESKKEKQNCVGDFLNWVLRTHLAEADAEGHRVVPANLHHPFPRTRVKFTGKMSDLGFSHVLSLDPCMADWQALASEWLGAQKTSVARCREALDKFLVKYLIGRDLDRNPIRFLHRDTPKLPLIDVLMSNKTRGTKDVVSGADVVLNNWITNFLGWVLDTKLSDEESGEWDRSRFHNPVPRLTNSGFATPTETNKSALSIRYIKELRGMLAQGPHLRDWTWAQQSMESGTAGGDWFAVDPKIVNRDDPDCVWRERDASKYEQDTKGYPVRVTELWSPVRAAALYIKLELPLRTFQVRMLDSGEADTWRYEGGKFTANDSPLATGSASRPYQRGVFHRQANESGAGIFVNTNKTADTNKPESQKGYVIPWTHDTVLYWLEKLRNWQERYNPISAPTPWRDLEAKHFGKTPPHPRVLEARGTACFLFRDPTGEGENRTKPIVASALDRIWYLLLESLEQRAVARGETLDDGTPIRFVDSDSTTGTCFPPHALRVSLISYLILDLQLPVAVVSKLIAGHARIVMTLYYTKFGQSFMREVMAEAEKRVLEADQANHRRFLMDATFEQVTQRFASVSVDAAQAAIGQKSAASFVVEDKGICPVGSAMCDAGGKKQSDTKSLDDYGPVPGYPQERNCPQCRFFLTGPAFLPGLQAYFNTKSYEAHESGERHSELDEAVTLMEDRRSDCERDGRLFTEARELERLHQRLEAETEALGRLVNDMQAGHYLIARSLEILNTAENDGMQLVAVGELADITFGFEESPSELYQLEVLCENATVYPEIDARKPVLRRSQLLDCMLQLNGKPPIFYRLGPKQQHQVGNALMKLIQARAGSLKNSLEFVEGQRRLRELGIVDEAWDVITEGVAGTPALEIINAARSRRSLPFKGNDEGASDAS
jgi:hypothetical protein